MRPPEISLGKCIDPAFIPARNDNPRSILGELAHDRLERGNFFLSARQYLVRPRKNH